MSSFVPLLSDELPEEEQDRRWKYRTEYYKQILTEQFQLCYFAHVDFRATDLMAVSERKFLHLLLANQKQTEKEAHEQALRDAEAKSKTPKHSKPKKARKRR